jgi:acyl carrier protein
MTNQNSILRTQLAELVAKATDGDVPAPVALAGEASLTALGVTSLATLRLIDAVEERYGVELDPADRTTLDSVGALATHLAAHGVQVED